MLSNVVIPEAANDIANFSRDKLSHEIRKRNDGSEYFIYYLVAVADLLGIEYEIRSPFWLLQPNNVQSIFRKVFETLCYKISQLGFNSRIIRQNNAFDILPPFNKKRIIISFHTYGERANLWHLKDASLPDRFFFSKNGYSGWVKLSTTQTEFVEKGNLSNGEIIDIEKFCFNNILNAASIYTQPQPQILDLPDDIIFFPLQMTSDTVADHWNFTLIEAINIAVKATKNNGKFLAIKRHPLCQDLAVYEALEAANQYDHVRIVDCSIHDILPICSLVIVGNSSVGLAALLYGKPILSFGASEYDICTTICKNPDELLYNLTNQNYRKDWQKIVRFFKIYRDELTFKIDDEKELGHFLLNTICECVENL